MIPLIVILITYLSSVSNQKEQVLIQQRQEAAQWDIKASEILFASDDIMQMRSRYKVLNALFPDRMKRFGTSDNFDPLKFGNKHEREIRQRKDLFKMISSHPESAEKIIATWRALFPSDEWVQKLSLTKIYKESGLYYPWSFGPGAVSTKAMPPPIAPHK